MAENSTGSDPLGATTQPELDQILNGDYKNVFRAQDYFPMDISKGHIFDVVKGNGIMRSNVGGDTLVKMIKVSYSSLRYLTMPNFSDAVARFACFLGHLGSSPSL